MKDNSEFISVASASDGISGSIIACALESAGIPVEVRGARSGRLFAAVPGVHGAVNVMVPRVLAADAKEILAALEDEGSGG